jgi:NifU-like protein
MSNPFIQAPSLFFEEALLKKKGFKEYLGHFDLADAAAKFMRVVTGLEISPYFDQIRLHLLVDQEDGVIADVKFEVFGQSIYYLVLEAVAELVLLKSYLQAEKISSTLIESRLKKDLKDPLPRVFDQAINLVLFVLDEALSQCHDICIDDKELTTPLEKQEACSQVPNWLNLDLKVQLGILEEVIAQDIRPYIELDEGGIEIVSLKEGLFLTIGYKGACTTCHSSTGSTLNAVQQILRNKVFPALVVIPDSSWLGTAHE